MQENEGIKKVIEQDIWGTIKEFLNYELIYVGSESGPVIFTVGLLLSFILSVIFATLVLRGIRILVSRNMPYEDKLKVVSVFGFIRYFVYIILFLHFLSAAGVNIILLLTASAALFVGLGLALRELFQDIIGGIAILIDQSLHVGDIIEVDNKVGRVIEVRLRTTRALTRDDKIIIVPNHKFISDIVYNYTQNHNSTREFVQVRAPFGSDTQLVKTLLLECAAEQKGILKSPEPFVLLEEFAESAHLFGLYFYIEDSFVDPKIKSELRFKIDAKFKEHHINIPFPQRDVHFFEKSNQEKIQK